MNSQFVANQILYHENAAMLLTSAAVLVLVGLLYIRSAARHTRSRILTVEVLFSICALLTYAGSFIHHPEPHDIIFMILTATAYISIYAALYLSFSHAVSYLNDRRKRDLGSGLKVFVLVVCIVCAVLWFLSLFGNDELLPEISQDRYDLLFWIGHAAEIVASIAIIYYVRYHRRILSVRESLGLAAVPVLILIFALLEPLSPGLALRYVGLMLGNLMVFTTLYGETSQSRGSLKTFDVNPRTALALGRIKPHYVGNVLSSIYYLCEINPTHAQSIIGAFSDYIRSVLETINNDGLVPFTYELNIIRNYLTLEKLRFEENLHVDYDVDITDFKVPPLSIQPLVENAIKKGIAFMDRPGTVHIETRHLAGNIVQIRVIDDGVGFDPSEIKDNPDYSDIRILQERIKDDAGGNLTIESSPGHGAMAIVALPLGR